MIRNPNFQVRKRKWKTVLFLLRKRKRKIEEPCNDVKHPNDVEILDENNLGDSRWHIDHHHHDDDEDDDDCCCSGADERDENPRNDLDQKFEGSEKENPSLGLDQDVAGGEGEKEEVDESSKLSSLVVYERKKDGGDTPPDDDCCPICFDNFSIACKTNCGHWFCANCILQFWTYRTVLQKCNCPICARPISKLTPEASLLMMHEVEVVEVLKNVQRYNRLFQGGINGVIRKAFEVPNLFKRMLSGLMDPDRFRGNYYAMRFFAEFMIDKAVYLVLATRCVPNLDSICYLCSVSCSLSTPWGRFKLFMSCIYNIGSFDFIPTGTLGVRRLFDLCAIALVVVLCLVGICHRLVLRQRVRRFAANNL